MTLQTLFIAGLLAQSAVSPQTRTLVISDGRVSVDGQIVDAGTGPVSLKADSIIRTGEGRAEVTLATGTIVFLDSHTSVRGVADRSSAVERMQMLGGSAILWTRGGMAAMECEDGVTLSEFGVFRFDFNPSVPRHIDDVCSLKVFAGRATVQLASLRTLLELGKAMGLNRHCGDMIPIRDFDIGARDDLDRWSLDRMRSRRDR